MVTRFFFIFCFAQTEVRMGELESSEDESEPAAKRCRVRHNAVSRDCVLYSKAEGLLIAQHLKHLNRVYIPINGDYHHCYFEAILCQVESPVVYTSYHLRLQTCMYMIENYPESLELLQWRLVGYNTSFYLFVKKLLNFYEWGEEYLTPIICKMWQVPITIIDLSDKDIYKNFGSDTVSEHIVLIYNGSTHYTGTGNYPLIM